MGSIRFEQVSCEYVVGRGAGSVRALSEIDLQIDSGERLTLFGPSGSGKTTLLRVLAGLQRSSSGRIWIGANRVEHWPARRRGVAFVFQEPALYPDWTVGRHLSREISWFNQAKRWFNRRGSGESLFETEGSLRNQDRKGSLGSFERDLRISGADGAREDSRANALAGQLSAAEVARWLGLAESINRKPHQLSGGERHRVALGRAVLREPAAFLFDEPFSALDSATRWSLREDVTALLNRTGRTAIFVTHDEREAAANGGRIGVLIAGRLKQVGSYDEVRQRPCDLEVARVVGDPPRTLLPAWARPSHDSSECDWSGDRVAWDWAREGLEDRGGREPIWVGVDSHAWRLVDPRETSCAEQEVSVDGQVEEVVRYGDDWVVTVAVALSAATEATGSPNEDCGPKETSRMMTRVGTVTPAGTFASVGTVARAVSRVRPVWRRGDPLRMICRRDAVSLFCGDSAGRLLKAGRA